MMQYKKNHYFTNAELEAFLKQCEKQYPQLCTLETIGSCPSGKSIWLLTITDRETGSHQEKPAYWVDGNTHANELAGSQACIYLIHHVLSQCDANSEIKQLLGRSTFYVVPRISVDGVESIMTRHYNIRSSDQLWPHKNLLPGFYEEDIDGDGHTSGMRIEDPAGPWKVSKKDPRLMLLREPDDCDPNETYYQLLPEGQLYPDKNAPFVFRNRFGIDMNRQFPTNWEPQNLQQGSGEAALSQSESRAVYDAIVARPNIVGAQSFHTFSAVILRPLLNQEDHEMDFTDLEVYKALGKRGTEITDYPNISVFQDFCYHPKKKFYGSFLEWAYNSRGIYAFTNEMWHLAKKAGVEVGPAVDWFARASDEDKICSMLKWCDDNLQPGTYFKEWKPFDHPQLGKVELGGWKGLYVWSNPPHEFLQEEVEKNVGFVLACAKSNPHVVLHEQNIEQVTSSSEEKISTLRLTVKNQGYLPTYGSSVAKQKGTCYPARMYAEASSGLEILQGEADRQVEHLQGRYANLFERSMAASTVFRSGRSLNAMASFEWTVKGTGTLHVKIDYAKGGVFRHTFEV
ncbi:MAG: M14 family metallopeptidase [Bdellovibrionota bacterium]